MPRWALFLVEMNCLPCTSSAAWSPSRPEVCSACLCCMVTEVAAAGGPRGWHPGETMLPWLQDDSPHPGIVTVTLGPETVGLHVQAMLAVRFRSVCLSAWPPITH